MRHLLVPFLFATSGCLVARSDFPLIGETISASGILEADYARSLRVTAQGEALAALARCCDASVNAVFDLTTDDPPSTVQLELVRLGAIPLSRDAEVQVDGRSGAQFGIPSLETCDPPSCSSTGPCEEEYQVELVQLPGGGATAFDLELRIWVIQGPGFFDAFDATLLPEIEIAWIDEPN